MNRTSPHRAPANVLASARAFAAVLVCVLAGCSTPAVTQFHSLLQPPGAAATPSGAASPESLPLPGVEPLLYDFPAVSIPEQVNQPQLVVRNADDSLTMLEQQRWVAPLADEFKGAISERLGRRFKVQLARQLAPGQRAAERLTLDVIRLEAMPGEDVRLEAAWSVRTLSDPVVGVSCRSEIRQSIGPGYEAVAAGYRAAVQLLADEIGPVMQSLRGGAASCR